MEEIRYEAPTSLARASELLREPGATDLDGLLRAIDAKVDSLIDMDEPGIEEVAVDLAALAACLAVATRRSPSSDASA